MKPRIGILAALILLGALGTGCNSPAASLNLYVVDALNGHQLEGVRVEHRSGQADVVSVLRTDSAGHVDGLAVHRDDKLSFSIDGYKPVRVVINFGTGLPIAIVGHPLQSVPPPGDDKAAREADVPIEDADALPISPENVMTVLMYPK